MTPANTLNCPNCGQAIDVNDILYHQLEEKARKEVESLNVKEKHAIFEEKKKVDEAVLALAHKESACT